MRFPPSGVAAALEACGSCVARILPSYGKALGSAVQTRAPPCMAPRGAFAGRNLHSHHLAHPSVPIGLTRTKPAQEADPAASASVCDRPREGGRRCRRTGAEQRLHGAWVPSHLTGSVVVEGVACRYFLPAYPRQCPAEPPPGGRGRVFPAEVAIITSLSLCGFFFCNRGRCRYGWWTAEISRLTS